VWSSHARFLYTRKKDPVTNVQEADRILEPVWKGAEILAPTGICYRSNESPY